MRQYKAFSVCTAQALDYVCAECGITLSDEQKQSLLLRYRTLPAFDDVKPALEALAGANLRLYAFSNGTVDAVLQLLVAAGIDDFFDDVVSVDDIKSFKPDPRVYAHFLDCTNSKANHASLVSANPFDVLGAMNVGIRGIWLQRDAAQHFDPWGPMPDFTIGCLTELIDAIKESR